jgi:hypothetical protein
MSHKVCLIACASTKKPKTSKAEEIYISSLFTKSLDYAKKNNFDIIFILSAKHHLLKLDDIIDPYNLTLNSFSKDKIIYWSKKVYYQLLPYLKEDSEITFLAGNNYRKYLIPLLKKYKIEIPMSNLGIGKQLKYLTDKGLAE